LGQAELRAARGAASRSNESMTVVGMLAEVAVTDGEVKVERVVIAASAAVVVNPRGVGDARSREA